MFRFFEKQVPPYPAQEPKVPPKGFFAFVWACTQGMRGWIGLMTLTSALLAVYEAVLFAIMGRVVDWLGTVTPATFWDEQRGMLLGIAGILLGSETQRVLVNSGIPVLVHRPVVKEVRADSH